MPTATETARNLPALATPPRTRQLSIAVAADLRHGEVGAEKAMLVQSLSVVG